MRHFHVNNLELLSCSDPKFRVTSISSQNGILGHYLGNITRYNLETMLWTQMQPFHFHESNLGLLSCSDPEMSQLIPMGSQNGLFGHYLGNKKRYDPGTMLYPHKCGYFASNKWFGVLISVISQDAQIEPSGQPKWLFWTISWERKEIRP